MGWLEGVGVVILIHGFLSSGPHPLVAIRDVATAPLGAEEPIPECRKWL